MIIKIFKNRGSGSAKASIDYLLGKDREREKARVLKGSAELSLLITNNLDFKNKYTVGCLSFEESVISLKEKKEVIKRFERAIFAGLEEDQYNILWVEHRDKGRVELNFFIPNVELSSGKRLQPYYDRTDRGLIDSFKKVINSEMGFSDPDDPKKKQLVLLDVNKTPRNVVEAKNRITEYIVSKIKNNVIHTQSDVVNELKTAGFEIARVTDKSISLKNPEGDNARNIRLKGFVYENRRFDRQLGEEYRRTIEEYEQSFIERSGEARERFEREIKKRTAYHRKRYGNLDKGIGREEQGVELGFGKKNVSRGVIVGARGNSSDYVGIDNLVSDLQTRAIERRTNEFRDSYRAIGESEVKEFKDRRTKREGIFNNSERERTGLYGQRLRNIENRLGGGNELPSRINGIAREIEQRELGLMERERKINGTSRDIKQTVETISQTDRGFERIRRRFEDIRGRVFGFYERYKGIFMQIKQSIRREEKKEKEYEQDREFSR